MPAPATPFPPLAAPVVFFAVRQEAAFSRLPGLRCVVTGMGARRAVESARRWLTGPRPSWVLTCGFAGGLDPELETGTVLFELDALLASMEAPLRSAGARPGVFYCHDRVLVTVAEKAACRAATGADAVEMESGALRALCRKAGVPSGTLRVISDAAGENLPLDFNRLLGPRQELRFGRLLWTLARDPGAVRRLWRFQGRLHRAARQLGSALAAVAADQAVASP